MQLSEDQQRDVDFFGDSYFPWYYQKTTSPKFMFHGHTLMNRDESGNPVSGTISSPHYNAALNIFNNFCLITNINYKTIFRASINSTSYHEFDKCDIHVDHAFEHKNFIFYINDVSKGSTFIYNNTQTEIEDVIVPQKNKGVIWDGRPHTHGCCAPNERRLVLIVTFI